MGLIIIIGAGVLLAIFIVMLNQEFKFIADHGHQTFEGMRFSTQEFYLSVEEKLKQKEIPDLTYSRVHYATGGMLSTKREYLRVRYKEYCFDVCAAPFAKDFFVSWWQSEVVKRLEISFGPRRRQKTFYEMDTELMFRQAVRLCVDEAIEEMKHTKGVRQLVQGDWYTDKRAIAS